MLVFQYVKALKEVPLDLKWTHTYARTHQLKSQVTMISTNEKLLALTGSMETLSKYSKSFSIVVLIVKYKTTLLY